MKKAICTIIFIVLLAVSPTCYAMELSAASAVIIEAETGAIIYGKDAHAKRTMASTTKIMTAICALEEGILDKKVKINSAAVGVEGS